MIVPEGATSRFVEVDGSRIHYFEAGDPAKPHLLLLHSCEIGSSAEFSWEANFPTLARHFHVLAPDTFGYGLSDKLYDFGGGHMPYRIRMLRRFLQIQCIAEADFIGTSCGASMLLTVAAQSGPAYRNVLPIRRLVMVSPSAIGTRGPAQALFDAYDGSRDAMRAILRSIFCAGAWAEDEVYLQRRHAESLRPGHWETIAAARLAMPGRPASPRPRPPWTDCVAPAMFITGDHDAVLVEKDGGIDSVRGIAGAVCHVVPQSGHCTQIEHPAIFHRLVLDFLDP